MSNTFCDKITVTNIAASGSVITMDNDVVSEGNISVNVIQPTTGNLELKVGGTSLIFTNQGFAQDGGLPESAFDYDPQNSPFKNNTATYPSGCYYINIDNQPTKVYMTQQTFTLSSGGSDTEGGWLLWGSFASDNPNTASTKPAIAFNNLRPHQLDSNPYITIINDANAQYDALAPAGTSSYNRAGYLTFFISGTGLGYMNIHKITSSNSIEFTEAIVEWCTQSGGPEGVVRSNLNTTGFQTTIAGTFTNKLSISGRGNDNSVASTANYIIQIQEGISVASIAGVANIWVR